MFYERKNLISQCFSRLILLSVLLLFWHPAVAVGRKQKVWFFKGNSIPAPPKQHSKWDVPECALPKSVIDAVKVLYKLGFADPRGCEYREITVPMGSDAWGGFFLRKTHGWVLPEVKGNSQRFAVLWNGLVYPVIAVGNKASFRDDVQHLVDHNIQFKEISTKHLKISDDSRLKRPQIFSNGFFPYQWYGCLSNSALLLRLGEGELAEKVYQTGIAVIPAYDKKPLPDKFKFDYKWSLFSRALAAAMYGDDKLSLCYAEQFAPLIKGDKSKFALTAGKLLSDQRRRVQERLHPLPAPCNKIESLIRDLENVNKRQWGQPGGVILGNDKRVKALIAIGDPAVEPLLDCLENDRRLTRSVSFGRDFFQERTVITVADAAYVALSGILKQSFFSVGCTSDNLSRRDSDYHKRLAQQIRKHYNRYKNMSIVDKWYNILKNDDESAPAQLQAAAGICRKSNVKVIPNSGAFSSYSIDKPGTGKIGMKGEVLRAKKNPSVSDLLNLRAVEYLPKGRLNTWSFENAYKMALLSAEWDLPNSLPALLKVSDAIYLGLSRYSRSRNSHWTELLVPLTVQRVKAGDKAALYRYCQIVLAHPGTVLGEHSRGDWEKYLKPLYVFPEENVSVATAETIFNTHGNTWNKYFGEFKDAQKTISYYRRFNPDEKDIFAEFMRLVPYRKHVLAGLSNKTEIIEWKTRITPYGLGCGYEFMDKSQSGNWSEDIKDVKSDPRFPGNNTTQILRVCDAYAKALSSIKGAGYPVFRRYWNVADRDKVINKIRNILSKRIQSKAKHK